MEMGQQIQVLALAARAQVVFGAMEVMEVLQYLMQLPPQAARDYKEMAPAAGAEVDFLQRGFPAARAVVGIKGPAVVVEAAGLHQPAQGSMAGVHMAP